MYNELLELCGFEPEEIKNEAPRIEKAFDILGIDEADAERSAAHMRQYQDVDLMGLRILRGVGIRELINLVLARKENKKVVYLTPTMIGGAEAFMLAGGDEPGQLYSPSPELLLALVLGGVLGAWHLTPLLEAGEENGLRAGQSHCGGFQLKIGAISKGIIPKPDLLLTMGGVTCTQATGADTLAHELFDIPVVYVDTTDYPEHDYWPEISPRHVAYAAHTFRRCIGKFEQITGYKVTEEIKKRGIVGAAKTIFPLTSVVEMLKRDPVPIGLHELTLVYYLAVLPLRPDNRERAIKATNLLFKEVAKRVKEGKGIAPKGTPRIFLTGATFVDDTVMHMVNSTGVVVGACAGLCLTAMEKVKTSYETWEERVIAGIYRKAFWHNGLSTADYFTQICREFNVEGAVIMNSVSCRLFNPCSLLQKDYMEKELGFPVLVLEGDINDSRNYSADRLRTRMEAYVELIYATKAAKD